MKLHLFIQKKKQSYGYTFITPIFWGESILAKFDTQGFES